MNSEELQTRWARTFETILAYDDVDTAQASAFLSRLQPQAMSDGFLMLTADNDFIKKWIEGHFSESISRALRDIHGRDYLVAIEVDENQQSPAAMNTNGHAPSSIRSSQLRQDADKLAGESESAGESAPGTPVATDIPTEPAPPTKPATATADAPDSTGMSIHQAEKPPRLNESILAPTSSLTFENFVIGESNRMAYSMAVAVAEEPGRQMLNPLFIYGKSGLGKTHLMRAIQNYVAETRRDLRTIYVDSADFLSGYVDATLAHDKEKTSFKNFKSRYQESDILLIDDIQFLQGKEQTLDIVFQIFNTMVDQGKQVVLSADRAPKNITMDERYQSRFNSGGTFDIQPPETETKLGIIRSFVDEYRASSDQPDFLFPDNIARYIAENSSSNIRELKSAVTKVIYAMNAFDKMDITTEEVSRLLENHFSGGAMKKLTIADIQKEVERYYDVSHQDLVGAKRSRKIVYARQIGIYLSRHLLDLPYNYIAKNFGGRDHTTIMYSVSNIEEKMKENRELREELENIKNRIREM